MRFAIAVIVKNELPGLLEWIAFHRAIGVTDFVIIDNGSTDGTWELLKKLRRRGLVNSFRFRTLGDNAPQVDAYQAALNKFGRRYDVMAFIDADEFLMPLKGQLSIIPEIERLFASPDVSAVAVNWACFGSSGEVFTKEGLVSERFVHRAPEQHAANHQYKSLVRPEQVVRFFNPHQVWLRSGRYVCTEGEPLVTNSTHEKKRFGFSERVIWGPFRINHYLVKSLEEFLIRKSRVGSAAKFGKVKHRVYFERHDLNDDLDDSALNYLDATQHELDGLRHALLQPTLVERVADACDRVLLKFAGGINWVRRWWLYGRQWLRHGSLRTRDYTQKQDGKE